MFCSCFDHVLIMFCFFVLLLAVSCLGDHLCNLNCPTAHCPAHPGERWGWPVETDWPCVSRRAVRTSPEQSSEPVRAVDARGGSCSRVLRHRALDRGVVVVTHGCMAATFCAAGSLTFPPRDIQVGRPMTCASLLLSGKQSIRQSGVSILASAAGTSALVALSSIGTELGCQC